MIASVPDLCILLTSGVFISFLVWFGLLSGHLLGNTCSLGSPYVLFVFRLFVILVISGFVLRAGFGF